MITIFKYEAYLGFLSEVYLQNYLDVLQLMFFEDCFGLNISMTKRFPEAQEISILQYFSGNDEGTFNLITAEIS